MKYFVHRRVNPVRVEVTQYNSRNDLLRKIYDGNNSSRRHYDEEDPDFDLYVKTRFCINWNSDKDNKKEVVTDEIGRTISPVVLIEWMLDYVPDTNKRNTYYMSWRKAAIYNWLGFRNGPVPYTGVGNYRCGTGGIKIGSELRAAQDREFARKKRSFNRLLTDAGFGRRSRRTRGWKNSKRRKQWM